jgi:cystathionine beta-lyase
LDCRALNLEPSPYQFFLDNAKVAFGNGKDFGAGYEGYVRLNFGCPRAILEQALERIKNALLTQPALASNAT